MTRTMAGSNAYNLAIIEEFRVNAGRVGGPWTGHTLSLLHDIGARSGIERATPLGCFPQGDGRNGGSPTHPAWLHNLKAHPRIDVELGAETFTVLAKELDDAARAELWPKLVAEVSQLGTYQTKVTRQIPLFMLTLQDEGERR
jgi:deazaflavin-dependent oxidoreductase (nitroreductase family)